MSLFLSILPGCGIICAIYVVIFWSIDTVVVREILSFQDNIFVGCVVWIFHLVPVAGLITIFL